jgi:hypothetical protein
VREGEGRLPSLGDVLRQEVPRLQARVVVAKSEPVFLLYVDLVHSRIVHHLHICTLITA